VRPATRIPFSIDECPCVDVYARMRRKSPPAESRARSRAATIAHSVALDALSWITPPPAPVERKRSGNPSKSTIQSRTWVSSSVQAGLVAHNMPWTPSAAETRSPRTAGSDALAGKKPKKVGDCQCVTPGSTIRSRSARIASHGSGCSGAWSGSCARTHPGSTGDSTGNDSTRSR
jgi:hypothetical protein